MNYGKVEEASSSRNRYPSTARYAAISAILTVILSKSDRAPSSRTVNAASIFEKIIKRRARVIRTLTAFAGCFFFDHHSDGIERAVIALVFGRDSGRNRLIAFEAAGWIEVFALLAGVEVESA